MSDRRAPGADGAGGADAPCPCGLGTAYADCCGRFHRGESTAPTAERLMRSRYAAFAVGDAGYLVRTWHPDTRPPALALDPGLEWTGLTVLRTTGGGLSEQTGTVEFTARYRSGAGRGAQHENSRFARVDGVWMYVGEA